MGDNDICASFGHLDRVVGAENVCGGDQPMLMGDLDHFDLPIIAHTCFLQVLAKVAINHTNNWGVLYADKAKLLQFGEINRHVPEGDRFHRHQRKRGFF